MPRAPRSLVLLVTALAACLPGQEAGVAVEGSVIDRITGAPVADATVRLIGGSFEIRTAKSGATGEFRIEPLPPGDYSVTARANGYVEFQYGKVTERVVVSVGVESRRVILRLTPTASIEGRVLDESRQPLEGVTVYAKAENAPFQVPAASGADGVYRIDNLIPGAHKLQVKVPLGMRRQSAITDPETGEKRALGSVQFYPGVDRADAASTVQAEPGTRVTGLDIVLRKSRMIDFRIRVIDPVTRQPARGLEVELDSAENEFRDEAYECGPVGATGTRTFELISPGRYNLLVYASACRDDLPYEIAAEVSPRGAPELEVAVPSPVRLEGVIKTPDELPVPRSSLLLRLDRKEPGNRAREVTLGGDRRFAVDAVPAGPRSIQIVRTPQLPANWYVAGIRLGSQEALDGPVTIAEGGNPPLEIELADGAAQVVVQIAGSRGMLVMATVRPANYRPGRWRPQSSTIRSDGSGRAVGLPPGEYIVALDGRPVPGCNTDRVTVKLGRGESRTVQLRRCPE